MYQKLAQQAIAAALASNWQSALEANNNILSLVPDDTDALNRLARAYYELGDSEKAIEALERVLELDPLNKIAERCKERYATVPPNGSSQIVDPAVFLEEPGRTKIVQLTNIGPSENYSSLVPGEVLDMTCGEHRIQISTMSGKYVGRLPDDLAVRIIHFTRNGGEYSALVKSVRGDSVKVFIRETKKSPQFMHTPSFPLEGSSTTFYSSKRSS